MSFLHISIGTVVQAVLISEASGCHARMPLAANPTRWPAARPALAWPAISRSLLYETLSGPIRHLLLRNMGMAYKGSCSWPSAQCGSEEVRLTDCFSIIGRFWIKPRSAKEFLYVIVVIFIYSLLLPNIMASDLSEMVLKTRHTRCYYYWSKKYQLWCRHIG